jgi:hypothetical protein
MENVMSCWHTARVKRATARVKRATARKIIANKVCEPPDPELMMVVKLCRR